MKKFVIPEYFRSSAIAAIKEARKKSDPRKKDFSPTVLDFGPVSFYVARHFGFCYGVENAIEIAYKAVKENPGKRVFLLSEMIHNPAVNSDLKSVGIDFLMDTSGNQLIPLETLTDDDVVIVPAFGTTIEMENKLKEKNLTKYLYNTTCPFVEKVWNKASSLGKDNHTIIIHGKAKHEETRATFSHTAQNSPAVIVKDIEETKKLCQYINGDLPIEDFLTEFEGRYSTDFNPHKDFNKIGVVNQTTMLATETEEISNYIRSVMVNLYGEENIKDHFADTRDTLCYATYDNQRATLGLLETDPDLVFVVGGYNSSNTSHIVELLEEKFPTYFISSDDKIINETKVQHFNLDKKLELITTNYLPEKDKIKIGLTSGASCPDSMVNNVMLKLLSFFEDIKDINLVLKELS